jgi:glucokinase
LTATPKCPDKAFLAKEVALFAANSAVGLVADIGGTNARFALAGRGKDGAIATAFRQDMVNAHFESLEASLAAYLDALGAAPRPTMAAFGVASPVTGDQVRLTNCDWSFSISGLKRRLGWTRFEVVNDFVAVGHALPALGPDDWRPLEGPAWPKALPSVVSLVGPGTGFGVGVVVSRAAGTHVIASEGGHASFAPIDALELEILRLMLARFPRVSNERILSGPGLEHLYAALAEIRGQSGPPPAAPEIVENGLSGRDSLAVETVQRFCLILGAAMGDVALVQGAGAVAIAGGIVPRLVDILDTALVRARFEAKGRAQPLLRTIPIALIARPEPGLLGAARLLFA